MSTVKINPQDAPILVQCPYSGAMYNFQPMLKMMYEHYFFQNIEDVPEDLDKSILFFTENITDDRCAKSFANALARILLVKDFFRTISTGEIS